MNLDSKKVVVQLENVSMHFNMSSEKLSSLKEYFIKLLKIYKKKNI